MRATEYLKDHAMMLLAHITGIFLLSLYLYLIGNSTTDIALIAVTWIGAVLLFLFVDFHRRRAYFKRLGKLLEDLDNKYLISEVMEPSARLEDRLYREVLRKSNKSVIEKINALEDSQKEYREYIETWIHEVKLPLTAAILICENNKDDKSKRLLSELLKIEKQVQQVLFYARMEYTSQDYLIHKVELRNMVLTAINANKQYFIQSGMQISLELSEETPIWVSSDEKWVVFILDQIFSNCLKYRREENPCIRICAVRGKQQVSLIVEDNGIGIAKEEIRRVFDKGFTGKNGRIGKKSTGIGLYLCMGLCRRLGIGLSCESEEGIFTRILLTFPDSDFQNPDNLSKV